MPFIGYSRTVEEVIISPPLADREEGNPPRAHKTRNVRPFRPADRPPLKLRPG